MWAKFTVRDMWSWLPVVRRLQEDFFDRQARHLRRHYNMRIDRHPQCTTDMSATARSLTYAPFEERHRAGLKNGPDRAYVATVALLDSGTEGVGE